MNRSESIISAGCCTLAVARKEGKAPTLEQNRTRAGNGREDDPALLQEAAWYRLGAMRGMQRLDELRRRAAGTLQIWRKQACLQEMSDPLLPQADAGRDDSGDALFRPPNAAARSACRHPASDRKMNGTLATTQNCHFYSRAMAAVPVYNRMVCPLHLKGDRQGRGEDHGSMEMCSVWRSERKPLQAGEMSEVRSSERKPGERRSSSQISKSTAPPADGGVFHIRVENGLPYRYNGNNDFRMSVNCTMTV